MRDEDYQLVEHPRLELHIHVATKFVQVIITMRMAMSMLINVTAGMMITFLVSLTLIMVLAVLQLGSFVGLALVGPLVGAWRGRSLAAAGT